MIANLNKSRRASTATLVHGNRICIIGGVDTKSKNYLDTVKSIGSVHWLDLMSRTFSEGPSLNEPRNQHSTILFGAKLYTLGGRSELYDSSFLHSIEILDVLASQAQWSIHTD